MQAVPGDERLGTDRHRREDVVLDHGAQHGPLPIGQLEGWAERLRGVARGPIVGHDASKRWFWHSNAESANGCSGAWYRSSRGSVNAARRWVVHRFARDSASAEIVRFVNEVARAMLLPVRLNFGRV